MSSFSASKGTRRIRVVDSFNLVAAFQLIKLRRRVLTQATQRGITNASHHCLSSFETIREANLILTIGTLQPIVSSCLQLGTFATALCGNSKQHPIKWPLRHPNWSITTVRW